MYPQEIRLRKLGLDLAARAFVSSREAVVIDNARDLAAIDYFADLCVAAIERAREEHRATRAKVRTIVSDACVDLPDLAHVHSWDADDIAACRACLDAVLQEVLA